MPTIKRRYGGGEAAWLVIVPSILLELGARPIQKLRQTANHPDKFLFGHKRGRALQAPVAALEHIVWRDAQIKLLGAGRVHQHIGHVFAQFIAPNHFCAADARLVSPWIDIQGHE